MRRKQLVRLVCTRRTDPYSLGHAASAIQGIFNSNGALWQSHRAIAKPHFARDELEAMVPIFSRHTTKLEAQLNAAAAAGDDAPTVDVQRLFRRFTMDSFAELFFGVDLDTQTKPAEFARHFDFLQRAFSWRFRVGPFWRLWGLTKRMRLSLNELNTYLLDLIRTARRDPNLAQRTDLLAHYLRSRDETGQPFSDAYLRDMVLNFLLAGRDTTAALLTWTAYRLAQNPDVDAHVLAEIVGTIPGPDAEPTFEQLGELRFLKQVLNETLRLHPPVPFNMRTAIKDDVLPNGMFIPAGTLGSHAHAQSGFSRVTHMPVAVHNSNRASLGTDIGWNTYTFQQDPEYWGPDAHEFMPDRWTQERAAQLRNFAFMPFHAGPRICLGQQMAYAEARVALVQVLRRFQFVQDASFKPLPVDHITLTSHNGVKLRVRPRNGSLVC